MGYKCTFMDNEVYSADDVNRMFSRLTTDGVVLADSGNVLTDLNTATSEVTSEGVQDYYDSCKLVCADGVYKISEGVCFMADGSAITFDSDGYEVTPISDTYCYVYIKRNAPLNTIDVVVSDAAGEEDFVPIAEIDESGKVYDKRKYSMSKVKLSTECTLKSFMCNIDVDEGLSTTVDIGTGNFSRVILVKGDVYSNDVLDGSYVAYRNNMVEIADGESVSYNLQQVVGSSTTITISFTRNGQYIEVAVSRKHASRIWEIQFEVI